MKEGWTTGKFSDIFDLQMGKTPSRDNPSYWGGTNAWVAIADMNCGKYICDTKECITDSAISESGIHLVCKDTVIMSFKLSIGKTAIATKDLYTNEAIMSFNTKDGFDILPDYIYYYLRGYKWQGMNKAVMGMTLNKKAISNNSFSFPSLSEQQHIVEELDLLSSIIKKKKAQLNELDNLAQSLFYEMFGDPIINEKGWEVKNLKDISSIGTGATPSRTKETLYYGGGIPWVKTTEVHNCDITTTEETITQLALEQTNCKIYPPNTLLMAMYGQGKTRGQIAKLKISAATNQACAAIILDEFMCNFVFVYELLHLEYDNIRNMAQGGNQANLNMKLVGSIPIILPPLDMQNLFASKIETIEQQKLLINRSIKEVEMMFNSRMDYYFN